MNKEQTIKQLNEKLNNQIMYLTNNPVNIGNYWGYKYFLVWRNTNTIHQAFKSLQECKEYFRELENNPVVCVGSKEFKITK